MQNQYSLRIGFFSYISGTLIYFLFPDNHPLIFIFATTIGAIIGTIITPFYFNSQVQTSNQSNLSILKRHVLSKLNNLVMYLIRKSSSRTAKIDRKNAIRRELEFELTPQDLPKNIEWMRVRGFVVESYQESQDTDPIYDRISLSLGKYYDVLKPLHRQIKIHQQDGKEIYFTVAQRPPDEISRLTNFCTLLYNNSFLDNYRYISSRRLIKATTQSNPNMINFFTGGWFERYVFYQVNELLVNRGIKFTFLKSSRGQHVSGHNFELDLIFFINNQPLWIECKSGQNYNSYLQKYSDYRDLLQIPKQRAFLIVADLSQEQAVNYTKLWNITVVNINNFVEEIDKVVTNGGN